MYFHFINYFFINLTFLNHKLLQFFPITIGFLVVVSESHGLPLLAFCSISDSQTVCTCNSGDLK